MGARVALLYEETSEEERCPGEAACARFKRAAGETVERRRANACTSCELLPTKPVAMRDADEDDEELLNRVERLARERDSGKPLDWGALYTVEVELLLMYDEAHVAHRRAAGAKARAHQQRLQAIVEQLMSRR